MIRSILRKSLILTSSRSRRHCPAVFPSKLPSRFSFSDSGSNGLAATQFCELSRLPTLLQGCDYQHWLVVMEAPEGYPRRDEIVDGYIKTLAMALGSEEEARKSIYSVSTKYYYAFGCEVPENLISRIKSLPHVKWVLPDSYLCHSDNKYGGEPFLKGEVVPYDDKYHEDWIQDENDDKHSRTTNIKKARRNQKKN